MQNVQNAQNMQNMQLIKAQQQKFNNNNTHDNKHNNPQIQQIQNIQPRQVLKPEQNIVNNNRQGLVDTKQQQIKPQVQIPNQIHQHNHINQNIPHNQNKKNQTVPINNQIIQQQNQKMIFRAPKPLSLSYNPIMKNSNIVPPVNNNKINKLQQKQDLKKGIRIENSNNQINHIESSKNKEELKIQKDIDNKNYKKTASLMTVNSLAGLNYKDFPTAEFSTQPFYNISGYACNTYNGKRKSTNEDKIKTRYKIEKNYKASGKDYKAYISYLGLFDGHGGEACSNLLKKELDEILFSQTMFPNNVKESIKETFKSAEKKFKHLAIKNGNLIDRSGSCALIALIINDTLYAINLGDSRGLYSRNAGQEFYQISRDHKPNDEKENARIIKAGGSVYYANKEFVNGVEITLNEEQVCPGYKFPYRLSPSGLAVSII